MAPWNMEENENENENENEKRRGTIRKLVGSFKCY